MLYVVMSVYPLNATIDGVRVFKLPSIIQSIFLSIVHGNRYQHLQCVEMSLRWRHNERDSVSNHQPHDCLLKRLFWRRSKETSKGPRHFVWDIHRPPVNSPH